MERENLCFVTSDDVKGQAGSGSNREGESTEAGRRGGAARSSEEGPVKCAARQGLAWHRVARHGRRGVGQAWIVMPWSGSAGEREGALGPPFIFTLHPYHSGKSARCGCLDFIGY